MPGGGDDVDYQKKIESLKTKILEVEDDLLKLRAKKAALERQRDMAMLQQEGRNRRGKRRVSTQAK